MRALFLFLALSQGSTSTRTLATRPIAPNVRQRGSDSLPISVKLLNTGKTSAEAAQENHQAADATQINRRQLTANYILAGLALISVGLSWWTFHHTRLIARQQ